MSNEKYIDKETLIIWLENMKASDYIIKSIKDDNKWPPANVRENIETEFDMYLSHCVCKNCGTQFRFNRCDNIIYTNFSNTDYCPKCGAKIKNKFIFKR